MLLIISINSTTMGASIACPVFEGTFPKTISSPRTEAQAMDITSDKIFAEAYIACVLHPVDEEKCNRKIENYNTIREKLLSRYENSRDIQNYNIREKLLSRDENSRDIQNYNTIREKLLSRYENSRDIQNHLEHR